MIVVVVVVSSPLARNSMANWKAGLRNLPKTQVFSVSAR